MSSLKNRIELLEQDLKAEPQRISVYHDFPFAILRYEPQDEWQLRREVRLLATRLEESGKDVQIISLADLLWEAIGKSEGLNPLVNLELQRGYLEAQEQVTTYLSDCDWCPLAELLAAHLSALDSKRSVAFLTRVAVMAPGLYHMSKLLDLMQDKTQVTTIMFYPGSLEGTTELRFMDLKGRDSLGNYRVKIYG
jgi:Domain of unknown function (DUF1788)